jgi:hypothetical protein
VAFYSERRKEIINNSKPTAAMREVTEKAERERK